LCRSVPPLGTDADSESVSSVAFKIERAWRIEDSASLASWLRIVFACHPDVLKAFDPFEIWRVPLRDRQSGTSFRSCVSVCIIIKNVILE